MQLINLCQTFNQFRPKCSENPKCSHSDTRKIWDGGKRARQVSKLVKSERMAKMGQNFVFQPYFNLDETN